MEPGRKVGGGIAVIAALSIAGCGGTATSTRHSRSTLGATGVTTAPSLTISVAPTTPPAPSTTVDSTPRTTAGTLRQRLPPATVAPEVNECVQQLIFEAYGTAGPLTCANGDLNTVAWDYYAKNSPLVLTLGSYATPSEVERALCSDLPTSTIPIETDIYHLAALYYGWSFAINPTTVLMGSC